MLLKANFPSAKEQHTATPSERSSVKTTDQQLMKPGEFKKIK
jgi:hypothetical protein